MRILHTSDWHLGRTLEGRSRIHEQREFIMEISTICQQEGVNIVLIAGDVFDTYNPSAEAEELFYEALERIAGNGQRAVVVIAGNHDNPDRLHAARPLAHRHGIFLLGYPGEDSLSLQGDDPASEEAAAALCQQQATRTSIVRSGPGWLELELPGCNRHAVIAALPYPSEQRLNDVVAESLEDGDMQRGYSDRVELAFSQAAAHFRDDTVNLALSHLFVLGGRSCESEREIQLGGAYVVEPAIMPEKAHYVALGHLHRPQRVGGSPVPCRYSGSPLSYSLSEADQQKEVVLVDINALGETSEKSLKLSSGRPLRFLRFGSYLEALDWCENPENQKFWTSMEIETPELLQSAMVADLRKLHSGIISIRPILPGLPHDNLDKPRISELSLEEKFSRFVARETGAAPQRELIEMLVELLEGGETFEAG